MPERKVKQTIFGGPETDAPGNCWAACLATMLGVPIDDVPDALRLERDDDARWAIYQEYLARFNLRPVCLRVPEDHLPAYWEALGPAIVHVTGKSPRGDFDHGVVFKDGILWHDPHPSGDGVDRITSIEFWVPLDPARLPRLRP